MPTGQQYGTNVPQTTLTSAILAGTTIISVQSSSGFPATPFTAAFALGQSTQEPFDVTNVSGTTWTIVRAIDNTTAFAQASNTTITHVDIGRDFREARSHIDASASVHGLTSAVCGIADTQTLTNKTLTSPTITGTVAGGATYTTPVLDRPVLGNTAPATPAANTLAFYDNGGVYTVVDPAGTTSQVTQTSPLGAGINKFAAWGFDPIFCTAGVTPISNQVECTKFQVATVTTINNMYVAISSAGSGLTSNQNSVGIYNSSGTRIAVSGDLTAAFGGTGLIPASTGGALTLEPGDYYFMIFATGTTPPTFAAYGTNIVGTALVNAGISSAPWRFGKYGSGQTSLPASITLANMTITATGLWVAVA